MFGSQKKEMSSGPVSWLIVGLGNPGGKYLDSRHNAGWHVLDRITKEHSHFRFDEKRNKALIARGELAEKKVALVKPQTFMNLSGEAVGPLARFYKVPPENVLVIYDDLDLPMAKLRMRPKGGPGGHNGMRSVIQHIGNDFPRLRIGIGRPPGQMPGKAFVLQKFKADEWEAMLVTYEQAVEAIEMVVRNGLEMAMNRVNSQ